MTEIGFYHLTRSPLEAALPKLLERVLESGARALVLASSAERVEDLTAQLWTYDPAGFLPHGNDRDGQPEHQPIWLSQADENVNSASVLVLTDGARSERVGEYQRCLDLFDGNDEAAVSAARARWRAYQAAGHSVTYWQQGPKGWQKKAAETG